MDNPGSEQKTESEDEPHYWQRKHHKVQRFIAIFGLFGLIVLVMQWCQLRNTLETDQRSWVTVQSVSFQKQMVVDEIPKVRLTLVNSGRTPAISVKVLGVVYLAAGEPASVRFGDTSKYPVAVIGPNATREVMLERPPLGQDEISALEARRNDIYASGEIQYFDIFGEEHKTGFCYSFRYQEKPTSGPISKVCEGLNWAK